MEEYTADSLWRLKFGPDWRGAGTKASEVQNYVAKIEISTGRRGVNLRSPQD